MTAIEFIENLPNSIPASAIQNVQTVFQFDIAGTNGGMRTVSIQDGKINIVDGLIGDPKCKISTNNDTFVAILNKETNPLMAVMTGKVKISNQGELLKYAKIFGIM